MWKKIAVMMVALIGGISVGYSYFADKLSAASVFKLDIGTKIVFGEHDGNNGMVWDVGGNSGGQYTLLATRSFQYGVEVTGLNRAYVREEGAKVSLNTLETSACNKLPGLPTLDDLSNVSANDASYRGGAYYWIDNDVKISGKTTLYNAAHLGYGEGHKAHNLIDNATGKSYGTNLMVIALNAADQRASIRPFTYLAQAKVVFAAAPAFQDGSWHRYQIQKGICSDEVESPITRIRIQSSAMNANLMNIKYIQ